MVALEMGNDARYKAVKRVIEKRKIRELKEVLKFVSKADLMTDLNISAGKLDERIGQVEKFYLRDVFEMARLFGVGRMEVLKLADRQYQSSKGVVPAKTKKPTKRGVANKSKE